MRDILCDFISLEDCINETRNYISQILKILLDNVAELTIALELSIMCLGRANYSVCIRVSQLRGGY